MILVLLWAMSLDWDVQAIIIAAAVTAQNSCLIDVSSETKLTVLDWVGQTVIAKTTA